MNRPPALDLIVSWRMDERLRGLQGQMLIVSSEILKTPELAFLCTDVTPGSVKRVHVQTMNKNGLRGVIIMLESEAEQLLTTGRCVPGGYDFSVVRLV